MAFLPDPFLFPIKYWKLWDPRWSEGGSHAIDMIKNCDLRPASLVEVHRELSFESVHIANEFMSPPLATGFSCTTNGPDTTLKDLLAGSFQIAHRMADQLSGGIVPSMLIPKRMLVRTTIGAL